MIRVRGAAEIYDSQQHRHQQQDNERELYQAASALAISDPEARCGNSPGSPADESMEHRCAA
ncbi:MAG: hypothetical protein WA603_10120 [Candidatus Acidiferrales bacterium]